MCCSAAFSWRGRAVAANKPSLSYAEGFPYVYKTGLKRGQVLRVHLLLAGMEFGEHLRATPPIERPSAFETLEKYVAGSAVRGHVSLRRLPLQPLYLIQCEKSLRCR